MHQRRFVLIVAVSSYESDSVLPLPGVLLDAERFRATLNTWADGGVHRLVTLCDGKASRAAIRAALGQLAAEAGATDQVVLYFAGHGLRLPDQAGSWQYYFLPHDATPTSAATHGLSMHDLRDGLASFQTHETVVVLDCCHGGGMAGSVWASDTLNDLLQGWQSRYVMAASRGMEQAGEDDAGGLFTRALCDALAGIGVTPDEQGRISAQKAWAQAADISRARAARRNLQQIAVNSGISAPVYLTRVAQPARDEPASLARCDYLVPVFVGQLVPGGDEAGDAVVQAVAAACERVNREQSGERRFHCVAQTGKPLGAGLLTSALEVSRERLRQAALTFFDVTSTEALAVYVQLGVAIGMDRRVYLLGRSPLQLPAILQGHPMHQYADQRRLSEVVAGLIRERIEELSDPPPSNQHTLHQKMQIDALWRHRIEAAQGALYFIAGDLSWGPDLEEALRRKAREGVVVRVCCERPTSPDSIRWNNVRRIREVGAQVRLFDSTSDPGVRGFIYEPGRPQSAEAVFVHKEGRRGVPRDPRYAGLTFGERQYFYTARIYNSQEAGHARLVTAVVRLFETLWDSPRTVAAPD